MKIIEDNLKLADRKHKQTLGIADILIHLLIQSCMLFDIKVLFQWLTRLTNQRST